ncbi:Cthe_2314 family HEPN domain-containing protein [Salimicrobium jeotgali]|uniref:Cthe_2314 family HEPN domain-containing protein n=1 Tax=Salimicrobium jeotgali TaxID=1230341 RepID=UPI000C83EA02|nr:Cthe_2314 family HEPN domain-containing protein [Salimicrobium jeotgali]
MNISPTPFEDIAKINLKEMTKESPLQHFRLSEGIFRKENGFLELAENMDLSHWGVLLRKKLNSINNDFGYALFYYYKGIPDNEWYISSGKQGQRGQYFPHFEEQHHSNLYNFSYFVEIFFLKAFTVYETIGHLLFKLYDFKINRNISFNNAIDKLKDVNYPLYEELNNIKGSQNYKCGNTIRNDIAHNHPPYLIDSGVKKLKGLKGGGVGKYTPSKEIKKAMIGLLKSIKDTLEALERHL